MTNEKNLRSSIFFNFIAQIIVYLTPVILSPYLARVLLPKGIGINSLVLANVTYFTLVIAFGFLPYGTKKIANHRDNKNDYSRLFWEIVWSKTILFVISISLYAVFILFVPIAAKYKLFYTIYIILLIATFLDINFLFQGLEKFKLISIVNILCRLSGMTCIFIFVRTSDDLYKYILIYSCQNLINSLINWIFALKTVSFVRIKMNSFMNRFKESFLFFLPAIIISISSLIDKTMLASFTNEEMVGYYEEANKIMLLIIGILTSICPVLLSRMSYLDSENNEDEIYQRYNQMFTLYFIFALPAFFGVLAVNKYFIPLFFGSDFNYSVNILYILSALIIISPIYNIVGNAYYAPRNKIIYTVVFYSIGCVINVILNAIFIQFLDARGAALGTVIADTIVLILFIMFSRKDIKYLKISLSAIKPLIASVVMFAVIITFNIVFQNKINSNLFMTLIDVSIGGLIYIIMLLILKEKSIIKVFKFILSKFINEGERYE